MAPASSFIAKPLNAETLRELEEKLEEDLALAGRRQHADCAKWARRKAKKEEARVVGPRIRIDGTREKARLIIWVDDEKQTIQESAFVPILRSSPSTARRSPKASSRASRSAT